MERPLNQQDEQFSAALAFVLNKKKISKALLIEATGLTRRTIDYIVAKERGAGKRSASAISTALGLSYQDMLALGQWILDDNEPEVFLEQSGKVFFRDSRMIEPNTGSAPADNDQFSISEMIIMATKVLEGRTIYRPALAANIRAFHQAVCKEGELDSVKADMQKMKCEIQELRDMIELGHQKKSDGDSDKDEGERKAAG
jgi:hypothetical protein